MSATLREILFINRKDYGMITEPLEPYLHNLPDKPKLIPLNRSCGRGYVGRWRLFQNRLYLIDLSGRVRIDDEEVDVGLDYFFPNQDKVFASWFSGTVHVPHGKVLKYIHAGYLSKYEKEYTLVFEEGILIDYDYKKNTL